MPANGEASASASTSAAPTASAAAAASSSATLVAAPQLRDLRAEAAAFVPPALRKKLATTKARAALGGLRKGVDAAPGEPDAEDEAHRADKVGLSERLRMAVGDGPADARGAQRPKDDEYAKFLGDVGDLL
jgi:hypothetical protein